jgi:ABC-type multidrug transport system fused ATPase/permease subunit
MEAEGLLTMGDIIRFMIYTLFVGGSIGGISEQYAQIQKSVGAADRILDILAQEPEFVLSENKAIKQPLLGELSVQDLRFSYPSRPELEVLKGINFQVKPGQKLAIVGESGAGKSTLVQLLLGFYTPQSGEILFDKKPSTSFDLVDLRQQIGLVPQDIMLFGGTIYDNIAYGNTHSSEAEILEAATQANATEFILSFPEGFKTIVGDRGVKLSGGQRQRIAIARAMLKKPTLLILDEATSALDSKAEILVQEALEKLMEGRTSLIIAHRLSTIKNADYLIVLDQGKIVEHGEPSKLLAQENSKFAAMWKLQFEGKNSPSTEI